MSRRAHSPALQVEQLEDRLNPAGSVIPAGEFNWMQYAPTGELGQLVWNGGALVYRSRVAGGWQDAVVASSSGYTAAQYHTRDAVQTASQTAQLVFTSDGTPHVLYLEKQWNADLGKYHTLIRHHARTTAGWQRVETIVPEWTSQWGPNNLVAEAGPNNTIHLIFTETNAAATGIGNLGRGFLHYANNARGWTFSRIAETADLSQDVWFTGGRWAPRFLSLAVDAQNKAHVAYTPRFYIAGAFSTVSSTLMYATNRSGAWASRVVQAPLDGTADAGLGASIAVSPRGLVAIASYYVDRYSTGSPQASKLMYHTLVNGSWTHATVTASPDGYAAGDGARFTGFAPQLYFDSSGRANIAFSDEAGEHLPVSYANEFAGQIRLATQNGSSWSLRTVYRQTDPVRNQLFYPVAATYGGHTAFAGLRAVSVVDGNRNPLRTDFAIVELGTPFGLSSSPTSGLPGVPGQAPIGAPGIPGVPGAAAGAPTGWAFSLDSGAQPSQVFAYRPDGSLALTVTPFGAAYRGGVRLARGDVTGDGLADLITATGPGTGARVRVWDGATGAMVADFEPFPGYAGGLWVAAGDLDGDGAADIAVGADLGLSPHVKVFSGRGLGELASFYAYAPGFVGGVRVAMGDLNRDGYADIVTGPGFGAGPHVAMFDGRSLAMGLGPRPAGNDFYIFDPSMTAGLNLAVGDVDGDGFADVIAGPATGPGHLRIVSGYSLASGGEPADLTSMIVWAGGTSGLRVSAVDADGDGRTDVVAAPSSPFNGRVALFVAPALLSENAAAVNWFDPLPGLTTSVFVG